MAVPFLISSFLIPFIGMFIDKKGKRVKCLIAAAAIGIVTYIGFITLTPFIFNANYTDGLSIEIQINPEFKNVAEAETQALKYAEVFGQLPTALRSDVKTSWIHKGTESFGGGNNNLLICD